MAQAEIREYRPNTLQRIRDWYERIAPRNPGQRTLFDISTGPLSGLANLTTATEKNDKLTQVLELLGNIPGGGQAAGVVGSVAVDPKRLSNLLKSVPEYYHKFIKEVLAKEAPVTINAFDPKAIQEALSVAYRRPPEMMQDELLGLTTPNKFLQAAAPLDFNKPIPAANVEYLRSVIKGTPNFEILKKAQHPKETLFSEFYGKYPQDYDRLSSIPFLQVMEPRNKEMGLKAGVVGHEGRNRSKAIAKEFGEDEPYLLRVMNPDLLPMTDINDMIVSEKGYSSNKYYDLFEDPFNDLKNDPFGGLFK